MGESIGYIKLYRKLFDNPIVMKDADHLAVWVWLLLKAAWKESEVTFDGKRITLQPGQLPPISRKTIARELQVEQSKVQRILKEFENQHQIEQQTSNRNRLISICAWNDYQQSEQQVEQQVNNSATSNRHQNEHNMKNNKEYKEYKEYKELLSYAPEDVEIGETYVDPITGRIRFNTGR